MRSARSTKDEEMRTGRTSPARPGQIELFEYVTLSSRKGLRVITWHKSGSSRRPKHANGRCDLEQAAHAGALP